MTKLFEIYGEHNSPADLTIAKKELRKHGTLYFDQNPYASELYYRNELIWETNLPELEIRIHDLVQEI